MSKKQDHIPLKYFLRLLRWICPVHLFEEIEGDLIQRFEKDVTIYGEWKAQRRFVWNVIRFFRPGIILRNRGSMPMNSAPMLSNYFVVSLRNIRQHPLYAGINILSLAIGLASCVVIYLFIFDESSFDSFHNKRSSIYRLNQIQNVAGASMQKVALTGSPFGPDLLKEFPEIATYSRFWDEGKSVLMVEDKQLLVDRVAIVDSTFLEIFDFELMAGNKATALVEPNTIILTKKTAEKFFGSVQDALGRTITKNEREFKITGVLKNVPENSHLQFDVLESMVTYYYKDPAFNTDWTSNFLVTYLVLHPGSDPNLLEEKLPDWLVRWTGMKDVGKNYSLFLQPFSDIHLGSTTIEHDYVNYRKFNGVYLKVFSFIGVFILVIAGINFMNLTTARSSYRWKEIGVRKSAGAKKGQLFGQFIFESIVLALLALVVAVLLDIIFIPFLNQYIGRQLLISTLLAFPAQLVLIFSIALSLGFLTGIYPSFYMTSANVVHILKGGTGRIRRSVFRSSLVIVQFGLALAMIVGTLIVTQQLSFMKNADVGFNKDQIMLVHMNDEVNKKFDVLKTQLLGIKNVQGVTASGQRLGNNFHQGGFKVKSDTGIVWIRPSSINVDYDYLNVYGIQLKGGRNFSEDFFTDKGKAFIINESMVKDLNLKNPLGMAGGHGFMEDDSLGTIIGVVSDFNFNSLHHKINNLFIFSNPSWGYEEISIKVDDAHINETIAGIKEMWDKNILSHPFTYSFLDEHFDTLYRSDRQMSSVVTIMAALAILISCMGLFGLAAITTERKTKEIGIRRILGATETQIVTLLSRNFLGLILASLVMVTPVTYYLASAWLQNFAYRIDINPLLFLLGGMLAMGIAMLTISYHTVRCARANPVKSLRSE